MYNTSIPSKAELPTAAQLIRSTVIAAVTAAALLVTVVLPSEYAIDPTGVGKMLGFTEMGEIKTQLAEEAASDRAADQATEVASAAAGLDVAEETTETPASAKAAETAEPAEVAAPAPAAAAGRADEMRVTLAPGEGAEVKLVMKAGTKSNFAWTVVGGEVNVDLHGDGGGKAISYAKERGLASDEGTLTAAFDGNHGWFWRNRGDTPVVVILKAQGAHTDIKRLV